MIKLAIMAVGGQGGGVLTGWIVELAEQSGWRVQSTVVAGVAQRTGATIYYVEMAPETGRDPVFALAPAPGDVDILIAAEMMEAGRAVLRGFVSPDRTLVIASTHRALAVAEKIVPGDGALPRRDVREAVEAAAAATHWADFEAAAQSEDSVISASLFGGLAASGALPFPQEAFAAVIGEGGDRAKRSLAAFHAGRLADETPTVAAQFKAMGPVAGPKAAMADWSKLENRVRELPAEVAEMAGRGLRKVVDYQDLDYGGEYLDQVAHWVGSDDPSQDYRLSTAVAKHLANAMTYNDVIRVADLKTRPDRDARIEEEAGAEPDAVMHLTDFLHPRGEEICTTLPRGLGRWILDRPRLAGWIDRRVNRGRRIRTDRIGGFAILWLIAGLRRWRRSLLRHEGEVDHWREWLDVARSHQAQSYDLAVEIINCRRLIKGYGDTHARGQSKFDRVLSALPMLSGRADAADWIRRLREAALRDEEGEALDGALRTIESFATNA